MERKQSELTVITKAKDLCSYVMTVTQKSPKHFRYTFVNKLQNLALIVDCLIHAFNCEVIDRWFGLTEDYMFFRSDMPFVIPGVPQFITLSVFAIIVFFLLSVILNIPEAKALWNKKKEN